MGVVEKTMSNTQDEIAKEREQARTAYRDIGSNSGESAAAWDAVEELEAEASHQSKSKSAFERYCDDNPGASECRVYEE